LVSASYSTSSNLKAGSYSQTVSDIAGTDASNYTFSAFTTGSANYTVEKASLTVSATGEDKVYDGLIVATITLSDNRVSGDDLNLSGATSSYGDKNAGTGKTVNVMGIMLGGTDAANYTWNMNATTEANIIPANLTVTANDASKTYDGIPYSGGNGVRYSGFVNGETESVLSGSVSYGGTSQGAVSIGRYMITPGGLGSGNYIIMYLDGELNIDRVTSVSAVDIITSTGNQNIGSDTGTVNSPDAPSSLITSDTNGLVNVSASDNGDFAAMSTGTAGSISGTGGESSLSLIEQSGINGDISLASLSSDGAAGNGEMNGGYAVDSPAAYNASRLSVQMLYDPTINTSGLIQVTVPRDMLSPGSILNFNLPDVVKSELSLYGSVEFVTLESGAPLPTWLNYDSGRKAFSVVNAQPESFPVRAKVRLGDKSWVIVISIRDM
ncbi:MAG TPA: YDG domain-containing protein, partial [Chlorobaculum sp.]|nr:YDG domain-containing protein [Chlorobaculum sp.]